MEVKTIVKDILLLEFFEKKIGRTFLTNREQVRKHCNYLSDDISDATLIETYHGFTIKQSMIYVSYDFIGNMCCRYPLVTKCLQLCKGKLSLCGVLQELISSIDNVSEIYLYFTSCSILEASVMLERCLNLFSECEYYIGETNISVLHNRTRIIFSTTICESIEELLINREHTLEKQLWNPVDSYVTTLTTSVCIGIAAYPIDITLPCFNLSYYNNIGMRTILPGLENRTGGELEHNTVCIKMYNKPTHKKRQLTFPDSFAYFNKNGLTVTRINNDLYPHNSLAFTLDKNLISYTGKLNDSIKEIIAKSKLTQYKSSIRPKFNLKEYLGKDYVPIIVGIDNDRYVSAFAVLLHYNIPKELFSRICYYWLIKEAKLAKNRLLSVCK